MSVVELFVIDGAKIAAKALALQDHDSLFVLLFIFLHLVDAIDTVLRNKADFVIIEQFHARGHLFGTFLHTFASNSWTEKAYRNLELYFHVFGAADQKLVLAVIDVNELFQVW